MAPAKRLHAAPSLEDCAACDLVIEAAPERLEIKRELFARSEPVVSDQCVLATNTSSLLVTAPGRRGRASRSAWSGCTSSTRRRSCACSRSWLGSKSSEQAVAVAQAAGEAMGKHVIVAADGPGFIVNRCNRPFGLEALRLLTEQLATIPEIDRACRQGGGFRMGPFEVMDLVGVDVGLDVSRSFFEQSFGEPRWRPSPITVRTVAAGRLGRNRSRLLRVPGGRGAPPGRPDPPAVGGGDGLIVVAGDSALAARTARRRCRRGLGSRRYPGRGRGTGQPHLILDSEPEARSPRRRCRAHPRRSPVRPARWPRWTRAAQQLASTPYRRWRPRASSS